MSDLDEQIAKLGAAIAGLEAQRATLGDAVVDPALEALRQKLADLDAPLADLGAGDERKIVTVLFVDVSGFTALSERLDPEEARALINACFEYLVPVVQKYEGTIDKFIGDEIMALFGAPIAHEDDPERALRAALEMMDTIMQFNREHATELALHIGVNTGPVVAGQVGSHGRRDYSVMGDAVNLAARLEDASPNGEIYVGPHTYRRTAPLFDFEKLPPLRLKGKAEAVEIYRLLGGKAESKPVRGIEGLRSSLIGRDAELGKILSAVHALQKGDGSVLAIIGEAGLGKSRLIAEARQSPGADVSWAEGRALSYAAGMSYGLARDVLYALLGAKMDEPLAKTAAALWKSVAQAMPGNEMSVYPYLARLLEVPMEEAAEERIKYLTGEALKGRILQAFADYVRGRANEQSLVLVWEDLHWCDPSSMQVLETLFPLTRDVPLLLLLAYRPDEEVVQQIDQKAGATSPEKFSRIEISPLTRDQSGSLIQSLLKIENLPEKIRELILDRAEGNPFFLEELLRSLLDAGTVVIEQERIVATRAIESLDVPETLQGVLMARIDRLAAEKKRALQNASVIGRIFQQRVLAQLYGEQARAKNRLDDSLRELQRREFIQSWEQKNIEAALQDNEYIFKHAITHDVAYSSLLMARRKELHKLAAEAIEMLFPDRLEELSATLAYHFEKAEAREKAIHYLQRAAERAQATFANTEAIAFYRSAIEQLKRLPETTETERAARLYEGLGDVLKLSGQHEDTRAAYANALALTPDSNRIGRSRLHRKTGASYVIQRRYDKTFRTFEMAEKELGEQPTEPAADWWQEKVQIQLERMHLFYWQGMPKEMVQLAEKFRAHVEAHGAPIQQGMFFQMLGLSSLRRDRYIASEEALDFARTAVSVSEGSSDLSTFSHIRFVLGFIHMWRGNLAEANEHLHAALAIAEKVGDAVIQARCLTYLAVTHRRSHHVDETRHYATLALELASKLKMVEYIAMSKANLAWFAWRRDHYLEAQQLSHEALESWHGMPDPYGFDWMALWPLIAIALARGDLDEGLAQARALFEPNQSPLPDPLPELTRAALAASEKNQRELAQTYLEKAVETAIQIGHL